MISKPSRYRALMLAMSGFATTALLLYVDAVSAAVV